jgi:hypothetical protein
MKSKPRFWRKMATAGKPAGLIFVKKWVFDGLTANLLEVTRARIVF